MLSHMTTSPSASTGWGYGEEGVGVKGVKGVAKAIGVMVMEIGVGRQKYGVG